MKIEVRKMDGVGRTVHVVLWILALFGLALFLDRLSLVGRILAFFLLAVLALDFHAIRAYVRGGPTRVDNEKENSVDPRLVSSTGQTWKLWLGLFGMAVAGISLVFGITHQDTTEGIQVLILGTGAGLAIAVVSAFSVTCPTCGTRLVWRAVSRKKLGEWLAWLLSLKTCPVCGYEAKEATSQTGESGRRSG